MREHPLLAADHEHDSELEPLRVVERHQRYEALVVAPLVGVGAQRYLFQKLLQRARLGFGLVVLGGDVDEFLQVLDPALGLDRALRLEPSR